MIVRRWGCSTKPGSEEAYLGFLAKVMIPHMRELPGHRGVRVLRRLDGAEAATRIVVVSYWTDLEAIQTFAGSDPSRAVVPEAARALLGTFDPVVEHYEVEQSEAAP